MLKWAHAITYIPWDGVTYLPLIPQPYHRFYKTILPYLQTRSTDVHTALSVSFVPELAMLADTTVNIRVLTTAVLLHDIGWGQLTPLQIANSLSYAAFAYSDEALEPKKLHASLGAKLAGKMLDKYGDMVGLSPAERDFVVELVRYHDQINPWPAQPEPIEYLLLGDADRLWSYTHENFWLDTIRKGNPAPHYLDSLRSQIESYFLTDYGKKIAGRLIEKRAEEVAALA